MSDENKWLKELKVGDPVIICKWWNHSVDYFDSTVEKITERGFIRVEEVLYKPDDGVARGRSRSKLLNPKDKIIKEMVEEHRRKDFVKEVMCKLRLVKNLTYEQAVEINKILEGDSNE